jgi:hypothetical protein
MKPVMTAVALLVGGAIGNGQENDKKVAPAKDTVERVIGVAEAIAQGTMVRGKITAIEAADHRLGVKGEDKKDLTFTVTPSTRITVN